MSKVSFDPAAPFSPTEQIKKSEAKVQKAKDELLKAWTDNWDKLPDGAKNLRWNAFVVARAKKKIVLYEGAVCHADEPHPNYRGEPPADA